ncbi:MAG TPA: hypothetical protein VJ204_01890 [Solirubrobacterales bacterium]|nr:hypothetical protein [Solirubrobacterales bacterium]
MTPAAEPDDSAKGPRRGRKSPSPAKGAAAKSGTAKGTASKSEGRPRKAARRSPIRLDRLRSGEAISLVAAIGLFILMFFDWFGIGVHGSVATGELNLFDRGQNAWEALEVIPLFLMLAIVVAVGATLLRLSGSEWKPAIPPAAAVFVLGLLASLLILIRMISPPEIGPAALQGFAFDTTLDLPIFVALVAALGIAYGGWRAMGQEGTSFAGIAKRLESPRPARPKSTADAKPSGRAKS